MCASKKEKPAFLIIDMVKDYFDEALEIHYKTLEIYRRNLLYPLLRVMPSTDLLAELDSQ